MKRIPMLVVWSAMLLTSTVASLGAEENKDHVQTKTGIVTKVDMAAKQVTIMVMRELTFTVTDSTKITQGDEAKKFSDIKVNTSVTVDYTRKGDTRTAQIIAIHTNK